MAALRWIDNLIDRSHSGDIHGNHMRLHPGPERREIRGVIMVIVVSMAEVVHHTDVGVTELLQPRENGQLVFDQTVPAVVVVKLNLRCRRGQPMLLAGVCGQPPA